MKSTNEMPDAYGVRTKVIITLAMLLALSILSNVAYFSYMQSRSCKTVDSKTMCVMKDRVYKLTRVVGRDQ